MPNPSPASAPRVETKPRARDQVEYPVREYIGAMTQELAQMARWDGDEALAALLDAAADRAAEAGSA